MGKSERKKLNPTKISIIIGSMVVVVMGGGGGGGHARALWAPSLDPPLYPGADPGGGGGVDWVSSHPPMG